MTPPDLQPALAGQLIGLRPLRAEDFDELYAVAAERWAREVVPRAHGLTHGGRHYPAHPIELRQGRLILWSNRG